MLLSAGPAAPVARAQAPGAVTVSPVADAPDWIRSSAAAQLVLSRPITVEDGRIAVFVGDTDWSGLAETSGALLTLRPAGVGFPPGEHTITVYLVGGSGQWNEIGRSTLRVLTGAGFEKAVATPVVEVGLAGQSVLRRTPEVPPGDRDTFHDLNLRAGLDTTHVRSGWTTTSQVQLIGVNTRSQALRFGELQDEAPMLDLGSYQVGVRNGVAALALGHGSFGAHRLLLNGFASRGLSGALQLGPVADVSLAAVNGSAIVGYGNPFGVGDGEHRVVNATVGLELVPTRRGALRVAASLMDGSVQAQSNFNQGAIRDAEESRGLGLQVTATDAAARFQLDAGFARSRFINPLDPLTPTGLAIVPVRETTRNARYLDASYALVQGASIGRQALASLTTGFRHSRVDPLYRSVALPVRADVEQNAVDVTAALGAFLSQFTWDHSRDNLADLDSVLTTQSRQILWSNALPLQSLGAASQHAAAWPTLSYTLSRVHQFGEGLPQGGLFDSLSQIPDQVSVNHVAGVVWQGAVWRGGYSWNRSLQDNRQPGRENADLLNVMHTFHAGAMASSRFDAGIEFAFEGADNLEAARTDLTRRVSIMGTWRPASRTSLAAVLTRNHFEDAPATSERRTTDVNVTFTQGVALLRHQPNRLHGQFFVRYVRQTVYGQVFGLPDISDTQFWSLNTGLSFRVF